MQNKSGINGFYKEYLLLNYNPRGSFTTGVVLSFANGFLVPLVERGKGKGHFAKGDCLYAKFTTIPPYFRKVNSTKLCRLWGGRFLMALNFQSLRLA